jgi:MFS family permease
MNLNKALWVQNLQTLKRFTWGGDWAMPHAAIVKRNLTWFFFDGLYANASDTIVITYLSLYVISLGATKGQIGLMSSMASLSAAILLVPSALLVEKIGHRQEVTILFGGGLARLCILALAFLPLVASGGILVWSAIALAVLRESFGNVGFPAWMSMTGDIVPLEGRGRFFGARNFVMGIASIVVTLIVGALITRSGAPLGYQIALVLAFILGVVSTYCFSRLHDPKKSHALLPGASMSLQAVLADMKNHPTFIIFCITALVWNFSINICGPFFNVYMLKELKFTAVMIGITATCTSIGTLLIQRKMGEIADRIGPRKLQMMCMFLIPILPFSWIFITQFWQVILLNILGGILWGTYTLVSFNFLLTLAPDAQRARYSALYQMVVTFALAGGAAFGSWLVTTVSYQAIFFASGVGRVLAAIMFARLMQDDKPTTQKLVRLPVPPAED